MTEQQGDEHDAEDDVYATTVTDEDDETWFCIKDRDGGGWIRSTLSKNLRKFR
jgi:hypothetical protein